MNPRAIIVLGALVLFLLLPWLTARDVLGQPVECWAAAGRSRWLWTVLVVVLPVLGPVWYLRVVRPDVRLADRRRGHPDG